MFNVGDKVRGIKCGLFVIIAIRTIENEQYAQVKEYNEYSGKLGKGEFSLPFTAIVEA